MLFPSSTMGNYFHAFIFVCFGSCFIISPLMAGNLWNDVVMVREDSSVTLSCFDSPPKSSVLVTWKMMSAREDRWSYLLSANCIDGQTNGRSSRVFGGRTFEISADASLIFRAAAPSQGRYSCVIEQDNKKLQERIVLLALIKLTVTPTPPATVDSTLRLVAQVSPSSVVAWGTWVSSSGEQLYTEISHDKGSLLSKLARITSKDTGVYTCRIRVHGNNDTSVSEHRVNVTVNERAVFSFTDVTQGDTRSMAALSRSLVTLACPPILGDYVLLYWQYPDSERMELIFQFDRWRRSSTNKTKHHLSLIDPATLAAVGNFSFLLSPALTDGGHYLCEVFLDDKAFTQSNTLSVLHGYIKPSRTTLDLSCTYKERSQVKAVRWSYVQDPSRFLKSTAVLGRITTSVALPVTPETAGRYACTLYLKNGNSVQYMCTVTMANIDPTVSPGPALPPAEDVSASSYVSSFSFLLFLIPMIAVAVGVLLWRQGYCVTHRSVEQSLSHHSGEVENIYENPDVLRQQTPPQGAVYMDLKPTGEMDVYKELDRYKQCCG
ncbi:g6f-like isoform X3 [Rhinichthys klamathensis goyatoka]|uniref:g6f-like isoform X3 n=1 Tax=Rhinichthys klamathensis goyatoka TaxID=3034132 RepID=UPI0024B5B0EC|nr:g6f-like isoform X3 [Rhinichthys klamathensis goyatoka]